MKIMVIGAEGQVGLFLMQSLAARHLVVGADMSGRQYPVLDIRDSRQVRDAIAGQRPDYVILTAALTHVDKCEEFPADSEASNVRGPLHVANACRAGKCGMAFISTDYIFDGLSGPYGETDMPNPLSVYGRHKLAAEKIIASRVSKHLIIRTMNVFSYLPGTANFYMQLYDRVQQGQAITAANDQMINPTHAFNLAAALGELIDRGKTGVYNLAGTTWVSRDEFARRIVVSLGQDSVRVKSMPTADFKQPAARPLKSGLLTDKAQRQLFRQPLWDLEFSLKFSLAQMKGSRYGNGD